MSFFRVSNRGQQVVEIQDLGISIDVGSTRILSNQFDAADLYQSEDLTQKIVTSALVVEVDSGSGFQEIPAAQFKNKDSLAAFLKIYELSAADNKLLVNGSDASELHHHDVRYFTKIEVENKFSNVAILAEEESDRAKEEESRIEGLVDQEIARASLAEQDLSIRIDNALTEASSYTDSKVLTEKNRAMAEEAAIRSDITTYVGTNFVSKTEKGAPNGVATLNGSGLIPDYQLPSYVDDVLEFISLEAFPTMGEAGKIYVAIDSSKSYRWSGSTYVQITSGSVDTVFGRAGIVTAQYGDYSADLITYDGSTVAAELMSLQSEIDAEEDRAYEAEQLIASDLATETQNRISGDQNLQLEIDAEETRALAAEGLLSGRISDVEIDLAQEIQNRISDVDAEETRAMAAESALGFRIDGEIEDRIAGDEALEQMITDEQSRALLAESNLHNEIVAEAELRASEDVRILSESKSYTDQEVLVEKNRAMGVESSLQTEIDGLQTEISDLETYVDATFIAKTEKGAANGIVPLNAYSKIEPIYLPSYVDDVLEFESLAAFPEMGEQGKIYVAIDTSKCFRWSGSMYIEISPSEVVSVNGQTGTVTLAASDILTSELVSVESKLMSLQGEIDAEETRAMAEESTLLKLDGSRPMTGDLDFGNHAARKVSHISNHGAVQVYVGSNVQNVNGKITLYGNFSQYPDISSVTLDSRQGPGNTPPGILPTGLSTDAPYVPFRIYENGVVVAIQLIPAGSDSYNTATFAVPYVDAGQGIIFVNSSASLPVMFESDVIAYDIEANNITANDIEVSNIKRFSETYIQLGSGQVELQKSLDMNSNSIMGLPEATQPDHAVNYFQLQAEETARMAADQAEEIARMAADQAEYDRATAEELRIDTRLTSEIDRAVAEELTLIKIDGSRAFSGNVDFGGNAASNVSLLSLTNTDLKVQDGSLVTKDTTRGKWVSVARRQMTFTGRDSSTNSNEYARMGLFTSNQSSEFMLKDMVLVGMSVRMGASGSGTFHVRKNGSITSLSSLTLSNEQYKQSLSLNVDFAAGDVIEIFISGSDIDRPVIVLEFAERYPIV